MRVQESEQVYSNKVIWVLGAGQEYLVEPLTTSGYEIVTCFDDASWTEFKTTVLDSTKVYLLHGYRLEGLSWSVDDNVVSLSTMYGLEFTTLHSDFFLSKELLNEDAVYLPVAKLFDFLKKHHSTYYNVFSLEYPPYFKSCNVTYGSSNYADFRHEAGVAVEDTRLVVGISEYKVVDSTYKAIVSDTGLLVLDSNISQDSTRYQAAHNYLLTLLDQGILTPLLSTNEGIVQLEVACLQSEPGEACLEFKISNVTGFSSAILDEYPSSSMVDIIHTASELAYFQVHGDPNVYLEEN